METKEKRPLIRWVRRISQRWVPPRLLKYSIALRNFRRGEPEIRLLPELVPRGRVAVDVGAYLGAYTFFLQRLASHVHTFEPQPFCAEFLHRAYPKGVTVHPVAVAEREDTGYFCLPAAEGVAYSQAGRLSDEPPIIGERYYPIRLVPLDGLDLGDVGFLKIDAEGAEERVLLGAKDLLARCRPVLLVEIEERHHPQRDLREIFAAIEGRGYRGGFLWCGEVRPLAEFSLEEMQRARLRGDRQKPYINNFIFRPRR